MGDDGFERGVDREAAVAAGAGDNEGSHGPTVPENRARRRALPASPFGAGSLTSLCVIRMIFHMRTTLVIDDELFRELKKRAAAENRTLSEVTQEVLRRGLVGRKAAPRSPRVKLPSFAMGKPRVDLADRNQLLDILDRS